ncbi:type VI secretion system tip protein VgrG, partial [Xenorhabdus sp. ZM]|uniref:type VI secretion system tip protein TssI/VgrG n=1 Tax=Xenorhabdus szentirmaii TaxID=290112 RepID=UPI0019C9BAE3
AIAVQPGKLFTLTHHPRPDLNQPWQVVGASHSGSQPQARETASGDSGTTLHSQFSFIRHNQHWRPAPLPKPNIDGPQIAKVVGPAGEEIFCDPYGRVRLQFPWDRYGKSDDQSSCWIRVTQPWAGQGWGMLAIPRIGQEVVVDFLHGDPDQPIVTGRTYHASNIPPGTLPGSKTQMAFRSKTHKGEGYNELLFEDAKGSEKLSMHAQKDMDTTVLNDRSTRVMHDHTESVGHNQAISVRADRHKEVIGMEVSSIGTRQVTVEKTSVLSVKGQITIQSTESGITIGNTKGSISIDADGNIHITGKTVIVNGKEVITLN